MSRIGAFDCFHERSVILTVLLGMLGLFVSIYLDLPSSGVIAGLTSAAYVVSLVYFKAVKKA